MPKDTHVKKSSCFGLSESFDIYRDPTKIFLKKAIFWGDTIFRGEAIFGEKLFLISGEKLFLETYPCKECRETFSKACRFRDQQKTLSGEKPYPGTVCQRHIPVKYVMRRFLKHVGLRINKRLIQERSHILVQYVTDISL